MSNRITSRREPGRLACALRHPVGYVSDGRRMRELVRQDHDEHDVLAVARLSGVLAGGGAL